MIHLTVAAPMGIDSIFFNFVKRLAEQNGHFCLDPPAQHLDAADPAAWIDGLKNSRQHHFVIGYRYPPNYWKTLVQNANTVCLLADPDGIARQVEQIHQHRDEGESSNDLRSSIQAIGHALEPTVELTEWILNDRRPHARVIPSAASFLLNCIAAFGRLEQFYRLAGVQISTPCGESFGNEVMPMLQQLQPVSSEVRVEIRRLLTLQDSTPARLDAIAALFNHVD